MPEREKSSYLFSVFELQSQAGKLMFQAHAERNAGQWSDTCSSFTLLEQALSQLLELASAHNGDYPDSPMLLEPTLNQLVNALNVHADVLEFLSDRPDREAAALLRERVSKIMPSLPAGARLDWLRNEASNHASRGNFHAALISLQHARDLFASVNDPVKVALVMAQLAEVYEWLLDLRRAREQADKAARLLEPLLPQQTPSLEGALAEAARLGSTDVQQALQAMQEQASILQVWLAVTQVDGRTSRLLGDYARSRAKLEAALAHVPRDMRFGIEFQLAATEIEAGASDRGYERLCSIEPEVERLAPQKLSAVRSWQAEAKLRMGSPESALAFSEEAEKGLAAQGDIDALWRTQWRRARALLALNRKREAFDEFARAASTISKLRRASLGHRLDSTYLVNKREVFEQVMRLAIELGEHTAACRAIEAIKARALSSLLTTPRPETQVQSSAQARFEALSSELDQLENVAAQLGWTTESSARRDTLLRERTAALEEIRIADPRWHGVSEAAELDLAAVQRRLASEGCAALTLYRLENDLVVVLVTGRECVARILPLSQHTRTALDAYYQNMRSAQPQIDAFDPAAVSLAATDLIPEELLTRALEAKRVLLVPHGGLHIVHWAALPYREKRLFEYCPIRISPNLNCLLLLKRRTNERPRVALIGHTDYANSVKPELALASTQLQAVAHRYRRHGAGVLGEVEGVDATCAAFRALACRQDAHGAILHVVCHGDFSSLDPMNSGLELVDGKVDAAEIATYHMVYDEVVLSACSTGYRPTSVDDVDLIGDDIVGLVAAFLEAGVGAVVVPIPPVRDDAAARFMTAYHTRRAQSAPPDIALQAAQQTLLSVEHMPVAVWGYTLYGG